MLVLLFVVVFVCAAALLSEIGIPVLPSFCLALVIAGAATYMANVHLINMVH